MSNTPASTAFGRLIQENERRAEAQEALRKSSTKIVNAVKAMDAPVLPKVPLALHPTPTPASRLQPVEPFKLDLSFRVDTALPTAAKRGSFWSRLKRWLG